MNQFLLYLLDSSACLALFYGLYFFALKKDSFHNLVRSYILFSIVASIAIPDIPNNILPDISTTAISSFSFFQNTGSNNNSIKTINQNSQTIPSSTISIQPKGKATLTPIETNKSASSLFLKLILLIYAAGALVFFTKFLFNIYKINLLVHNNRFVRLDGIKIFYLNFNSPSFSFLNCIFLQDLYRNTSEEKQVIAHEKIHIAQRHTIDILFLELVKIIFWFNPFIWLFKSSMVKVHEFYADEQLLSQTESPEKYKELLLRQYLGNFSLELVHPFNSSLLNTRIAMMDKSKSGKAARLKVMLAIPIIVIGLFSFGKTGLVLSGDDQYKKAQIGKLINYYISTGQFNGNILVYQNDKLLYEKSHGYSDFKSKENLNINTPFLLGSATESFTALSIIILKEQGKLKLSDSLSQYFTDLSAFMSPVTIEQLMNHTSGIPTTDDYKPVESGVTHNKDMYEIIRKMDMLYFKPGSEFRYSATGYILLAMIIEKVSGQSYQQFVKTKILIPAKMKDTYFLDEQNFSGKNRAIGYRTNGEIFDYPQFTLGNSGIVSTVFDLHNFETALYSGKIVGMTEFNNALVKTKLNNGKEINFGLGFEMYSIKYEKVVGHYSWYGGTKSIFLKDRDRNKSIIALTNNSWLRFWEMIGKISRILNDIPVVQPTTKVPVAISPETIKPIAGIYRKEGNKYNFKIKIDKNKPYAYNELSDETYQLYALAPDTFYINEYEVQFVFQKDNSGVISGFTIHGDEDTKYVKVE